ncbi:MULTISPECIES: hypothetical protein [Pandoraea]|uniref:Lipoprotein n=1 Tax=Pandoraea capi TaxID=2508286 RepID=A0ABY6VSA3_9BURK|nr:MULTISPECIES: hypothetical protein [Pandoraea]VVD82217.1 hypothetical protein PCA20602_01183 [Pandoraea capi]
MTTTYVDAFLADSSSRPKAGRASGRRAVTTLMRLGGALVAALLVGCSEYKASTASVSGPASESEMEGTSLSRVESQDAVPREVETRMRPVAAAVKMSGTPQVGVVVSGSYRWMADWPETDSVHLWEAASGPTRIRVVGRAREMMPSAGLRGVRIRYCVKPVIGTDTSRLTGHKTCSAWTTVDGAKTADVAG